MLEGIAVPKPPDWWRVPKMCGIGTWARTHARDARARTRRTHATLSDARACCCSLCSATPSMEREWIGEVTRHRSLAAVCVAPSATAGERKRRRADAGAGARRERPRTGRRTQDGAADQGGAANQGLDAEGHHKCPCTAKFCDDYFYSTLYPVTDEKGRDVKDDLGCAGKAVRGAPTCSAWLDP